MTTRGFAVHQVLATLGYGDAIGHEVLGIQRILRAAGYESDIFVESADHRLGDLTVDYRELADASRPENILIHHFSIGSRASRMAYALPDRMVLVYHNITPPKYFIGIHPGLIRSCYWGRRELAAYPERVVLALGDSEYNREELEGLGFADTGVLPVIPGFSHLEGPADPSRTLDFDDGWTNLLFVGRVIPNKKLDDVIRFFAAYQRYYNPRSRLIFAGSFGGFEVYLVMLQQLALALRLQDVHFLGHVSNQQLSATYDIADVFVCASEHEGFCVPIVEAFYKQIPVLAYRATAVPATMDGGGVLYDTKDPIRVAALIDAVVSDTALADNIVAGQNAALERLLARDFAGTLLGFVDRAAAAPARSHPGVTYDFWHQHTQADRLEELRYFRPALYRALPRREEAERKP